MLSFKFLLLIRLAVSKRGAREDDGWGKARYLTVVNQLDVVANANTVSVGLLW